LTSLGGSIFAAQASQPDDLLYPLKTLTEDIQYGLEGDPEDRLDLAAEFADRRLEEIEGQMAAGEPVSEIALARLEKHNQQMFQEAARQGEGGLENALRQIQTNLQKQNQIIAKLQKRHPRGGAPGLVQAQEQIQERMQLIENGIREPQGFQEKSDPPGQENKPKDSNSNKPETPPGQDNKGDSKLGNGKGQGKK
jgi:hypothetical protein